MSVPNIYRIHATEIQAATGRGFRATSDYSLIEEMDAASCGECRHGVLSFDALRRTVLKFIL
jgi:hypothetical protein